MANMKLRFESASIDNIVDLNSSFAEGKLKVMYTGENQNGSAFSQDVVEAALPSLRNIPIVAHYDLETNEIGSHDVEVVKDNAGLRLRNLTEPCGVVPESVEASFSVEADENGVTHNYLVIEPVILWKRQEVYRHITEDLGGHVDHSMEVNILAFHKDADSEFITVDSFEFEALCLLESARPCFEGSALEVFEASTFKEKMEQMMAELKETFSMINPPDAEIEIHTKEDNTFTEGGRVLDEKLALLAEFELDTDALDFSIDDFSVEELREKFEAMKAADTVEDHPADDDGIPANFELSGNMRKVLGDALREKKVMKPWGLEPVYCFEDFDADAGMVYATNMESWHIFGFPYTMNGDVPVIDFDSGKRMKRAFVEFDDAADDTGVSAMGSMFEAVEAAYTQNAEEWSEKFNKLSDEMEQLKQDTADIQELREFKANVEKEREDAARDSVFAAFEDLSGCDAFEALKSDCEDISVAELEEKCFAIRGRLNYSNEKFAAKDKAPKLRVAKQSEAEDNEPYGGLFQRYGTNRN